MLYYDGLPAIRDDTFVIRMNVYDERSQNIANLLEEGTAARVDNEWLKVSLRVQSIPELPLASQ